MSDDVDDYNDVLLDRIAQWRGLNNYSDSSIRYLCESELNPHKEEVYLQKAHVLATLELARVLSLMHGYPSNSR